MVNVAEDAINGQNIKQSVKNNVKQGAKDVAKIGVKELKRKLVESPQPSPSLKTKNKHHKNCSLLSNPRKSHQHVTL